MVDVSRRLFLGGALALVGASVVSGEALASPIPRIVGDGVHDDAPGLRALISRQPVRIEDAVYAINDDGSIDIGNGHFRLGSPLVFEHVEGLCVRNCTIIRARDFSGADHEYCIFVRSGKNIWLDNITYVDEREVTPEQLGGLLRVNLPQAPGPVVTVSRPRTKT